MWLRDQTGGLRDQTGGLRDWEAFSASPTFFTLRRHWMISQKEVLNGHITTILKVIDGRCVYNFASASLMHFENVQRLQIEWYLQFPNY